MSEPIIKFLKGPSPTKIGISNAFVSGLTSIFSAMSGAADIYPDDDEGLLRLLHYRIQVAKNAGRRSHWIGGRIFNRLSGEYPDYIPMSANHLRQTLDIVGIEAPVILVTSGQYLLRLDVSKDARSQLLEKRDQSNSTE